MGNKGSSATTPSYNTTPTTTPATAPPTAPTPAPTPAPSNASTTTLASTTTTLATTAGGSTATLIPKAGAKAPGAPTGQGAPRDWDAAYGELAKRMGFGATAPTLPHKTKKDRKAGGGGA